MIKETKRILFASDLSTDMKEVFEHAVSYSTYSGADIIVLHVMEEASKNSEKLARMAFGESLYQNLKNEHKTGAQNLLTGKNVDALRIRQAIAGFLADGESEDAPVETGSPIEKILVTESKSVAGEISQTAVEENCDAIVMGCKRHGLLAEAMGDNVVRKVLKRTSVPVFVVPLGNN
ncbi:MAG: universal stress protein [Desulfobacterales bacterium]|nr:universal stress protein [Desulfobacterales bacterium]